LRPAVSRAGTKCLSRRLKSDSIVYAQAASFVLWGQEAAPLGGPEHLLAIDDKQAGYFQTNAGVVWKKCRPRTSDKYYLVSAKLVIGDERSKTFPLLPKKLRAAVYSSRN